MCIDTILALPIHQKLAGYTLTHAHTQGHTQGTGHILNFYLSLSDDSNTCSIVLIVILAKRSRYCSQAI